MRVLLAAMPFSAPRFPSIGLSLLKPALEASGAQCEIRYLFLDYLDRIGIEAYETITDPWHYQALAGEWVFTGAAHGTDDPEASLAYFAEVFARHYPDLHCLSRTAVLVTARAGAAAFVETCAEEIGTGYDVVGFTTAFQQTMASLALARRIKERSPATMIVFGGANCRDDMGRALIEIYPFIDAVCLDEGDRAFPAYVSRLRDGGRLDDIPAMAVRCGEAIRCSCRTVDPVADLDSLPDPDFSEFFDRHRRSSVRNSHPPAVLFETGRGCWWGAKHHCTFCGINGRSMAFRSKSADRAHAEIRRLAARYGDDFVSVDAILDMSYFRDLLPRLAREGPAITMYCELKSNLRSDQMILLQRSGLTLIQPGIEALDTELLRLMRKGCTALQNVQTLKLAAECGLHVDWNLLHGFPGESADAYARTARLIPKLAHLQPPNAVGVIRADRFSPYFERPEEYGISLSPLPAYRFVFPVAEATLRRLAYHFFINRTDAADLGRPAVEAARLWQRRHAESALTVEEQPGLAVIQDTRLGRTAATLRLDGVVADVHRACWRLVSRPELGCMLPQYEPSAVDAALDVLAARDLVVSERGMSLALALRQPGYRRAPTWQEARVRAVRPYMLREAPAGEYPDATARRAPSRQVSSRASQRSSEP